MKQSAKAFAAAGRGVTEEQGDGPPPKESNVNIHLVEPVNHFVKLQDNVWESGSWGLDEDQAKKLVGGEIYFHKKRQEPSFYGGTILGYRVHPDGECQGKIVFQLKHSQKCRNVSTDKSGWSKDIKIVDRGEIGEVTETTQLRKA